MISNIAVALDIAILVVATLAPPLSKMSACLDCPAHLVDALERAVKSQPATLLDKWWLTYPNPERQRAEESADLAS